MQTKFSVIEWSGDAVTLLDQRRLPVEEAYVVCSTWVEVADAIREMVGRGAPAIGSTAAYGVALGARSVAASGAVLSHEVMAPVFEGLAATRPTARL